MKFQSLFLASILSSTFAAPVPDDSESIHLESRDSWSNCGGSFQNVAMLAQPWSSAISQNFGKVYTQMSGINPGAPIPLNSNRAYYTLQIKVPLAGQTWSTGQKPLSSLGLSGSIKNGQNTLSFPFNVPDQALSYYNSLPSWLRSIGTSATLNVQIFDENNNLALCMTGTYSV
ncbi:hypothetical protein BC830DRAFT_1105037 [Chytriomyces sp. MP71]|nr:hypothetical protein BC830DRAFT_1105037 [Chytriomyces sp. MP71]